MFARCLSAALLYFACVFGAGFALALVRVPLLVPRLGVRWAELLEMPFMAVVIVVSARWVVRRHALAARPAVRLATGLLALALLLAAEAGVAFALQGASLRDVVSGRDPVSDTVYALMLIVFALMPWLVARNAPGGAPHA